MASSCLFGTGCRVVLAGSSARRRTHAVGGSAASGAADLEADLAAHLRGKGRGVVTAGSEGAPNPGRRRRPRYTVVGAVGAVVAVVAR